MSKKVTFVTCFFIAFVLLAVSASAKIWRVNNNAGVNADFVQITTAVSSAAVQHGDTLYIEPTATAYTSVILTKRLVLIGYGYLLSENTGLQTGVAESLIGNITLDSLASGSTLIGIKVTAIYTNSNTDNITITRSMVSLYTSNYFANSKISDWEISKCYINTMGMSSINYVFENLRMQNCIIAGVLNIGASVNSLMRNNIFLSSVTLSNSYIANNIFLGISTLNFVNCTIKHNISQMNNLPAGNNNLNNISQASLFVLTGSSDGKYRLAAGSPAIGAGEPVNGITPDCGPFGTPDPYRLSGIPPIPTIYALTVPATVPSSATTMTITVSTRSNN